VISIAGALAPGPALGAGPYDPALTWRTVTSPRFAVHYHEGAHNLAVRTSRIAEEELDRVGELFGYQPDGRIDIVLVDSSDSANGSAQVLPRNTLRLYVAAPTELTGLSSYEDWLHILVIHELAHICDIDQNWGVTRFLRVLFGKYIAMNGYTPQFLSEGVAVFAETMLTRTGRGRSTYVEMLLRMAALEDRFLAIDQANVQLSEWPGPNAAYFYGGMFHLWLSSRFGRDQVRDLHQSYAATPVPYVYWPGAKHVFGESLPALWDEWKQEVVRQARQVKADVEAAGVTPSRRITFHGRNISGARYSPDGKFIIYSRTSPVDGSTVRRIDRNGKNDRRLVLQTFSPRFSFSPDGKSFYYSQAAINERFNDYDDLYRYDLERDRTVELHERGHKDKSLRARDPEASPDGRHLAFVQNALGQSWVSVGELGGEDGDELTVRVLIPPSGDMQQASPRYSPDGRLLAVSTWFEGGYRDVVVVDAETGALVRRITRDRALDGNPCWSADGRYLLYESDSDGISNVYAFELASGRYYRVTRVLGGAFQPDVTTDGRWLLFRDASGVGFDIHEMAFDPAAWEEQAYEPTRGYQPMMRPEAGGAGGTTATALRLVTSAVTGAATPGTAEPPREVAPTEPPPPNVPPPVTPPPAASPDDWSKGSLPPAMPRPEEVPLPLVDGERDEPYSPLPSIRPFSDDWVLFPAVYLLNQNLSFSAATLGADTLGHHSYVLSAGTGLQTRRLDWSAAYYNDVWYPTFILGGGDLHKVYTESAIARDRTLVGSATLPIKQRHLLLASYVWHDLAGITTNAAAQVTLGRAAYVEAGYRYHLTRVFPYSVSEEHGGSVAAAVRYYGRGLGGDYDELMLTGDARAYVNNPLFDNHVLALRLAVAMAFTCNGATADVCQRFYLGGAQGSSVLSVQTDEFYPLRGFGFDFQATSLMALYAEYRFPIWQVERGLWTLPVFLERLHGALFADSAVGLNQRNLADLSAAARRAFNRPLVGAGGELRADLSLGWQVPLTVRLGVGVPLLDRGMRPLRYTPLVYLSFGSAL
jgi:Tol biopolymer transport system component